MKKIAKTQVFDRDILRKAFEKYLETIIELKGHAWCMDVSEERHKMARLASGVLTDAALLESDVRVVGSNEILLRCDCGRDVILGLPGGQYQDSYVGRCHCEKGWILRDWPAKLPF